MASEAKRFPAGSHAARVLAALREAKGRAMTHGELLDVMYHERRKVEPRDSAGVLKVVICHLRRRLPKGAISTVWRMGYRLDRAVDVTPWLPYLPPAAFVRHDQAA